MSDGLEGHFPSQRLEVLGEVGGSDDRHNTSLEAVDVSVVESLNRGIFDRAVHSIGLTVCQWMTGSNSRRCAGGSREEGLP